MFNSIGLTRTDTDLGSPKQFVVYHHIWQPHHQVLLALHMLLSTFRNPFLQARLRKSDVGHRLLDALEHPFVHLELVYETCKKTCQKDWGITQDDCYCAGKVILEGQILRIRGQDNTFVKNNDEASAEGSREVLPPLFCHGIERM